MRSTVIAGSGPKSLGECGDDGRAGGRRQLAFDIERGQRHAAQQLAGRGSRNRAAAVGDFDETVAGWHGRANDSFDAEQVEADRRADDVGDGIDGADFVEVHLLDRAAVDLGLGLGQLLEDAFGQIFLAGSERAAVDHGRDVVQVAVFVLGLVLDRDLRGAEAFLFDFRADESAAGEAQGIDAGLDGGEFGAGVDEGAERHVAADSARTIEIGNSHGILLAVKKLDVLIV